MFRLYKSYLCFFSMMASIAFNSSLSGQPFSVSSNKAPFSSYVDQFKINVIIYWLEGSNRSLHWVQYAMHLNIYLSVFVNLTNTINIDLEPKFELQYYAAQIISFFMDY